MISIAVLPLFALSGAVFSVTNLPGWLGALTLANPLTYAVDAMRRTATHNLGLGQMPPGPSWGGWTPPVALELAAMLLLSLIALAVAARRFSRMS